MKQREKMVSIIVIDLHILFKCKSGEVDMAFLPLLVHVTALWNGLHPGG